MIEGAGLTGGERALLQHDKYPNPFDGHIHDCARDPAERPDYVVVSVQSRPLSFDELCTEVKDGGAVAVGMLHL